MKKIKIFNDSWYIEAMEEVNKFLEKYGDSVTDIQYQATQSDRFGTMHSVMVVYEDQT